MSTHITLANRLIKSIMSYENPQVSDAVLYVDQNLGIGEDGCIYFMNLNSQRNRQLFLCSTSIYSDDYSFSLRSSSGLYTIFRLLAHPETFSPSNDDEEFISKLIWFKALMRNIKNQIGHHLFHELTYSILIDMTVVLNDKDNKGVIKFNFSKHSKVSNKNVHYTISFDLSFNFIEVNFNSHTYVDNYQVDDLLKFNEANKLMAFYVLFNYYTNPEIHQTFADMLSENPLSNETLAMYHDLVMMVNI